MGNYKFRLSDMMPNAWFYKLKDMARTKNHHYPSTSTTKNKKQHFSPTYSSSPNYTYPTKQSKQPLQHSHSFPYPRKSYYFTRELTPSSDDDPKQLTTSFPITELPRKSNKERSRRTARYSHKVVSSAVAAEYSCRATTICSNGDICTGECFPHNSASSTDTSQDPADAFPPDFHSDLALTAESFDDILPWSQSTSCSNFNFNNDIVIDVDKKSLTTKLNKDLPVLDKVLPPIITKPEKFDEHLDQNITGKKETNQPTKPNRTSTQQRTPVVGSSRRHSVNPPGGVRLRVNSPRIGNRRVQGRKSMSRKSFSESLAIVKASFDPRRDFRESMVEMIVENNIRASKDLEDLLACYLSLNSNEYHDLIITVFKQIWFDLSDADKLK